MKFAIIIAAMLLCSTVQAGPLDRVANLLSGIRSIRPAQRIAERPRRLREVRLLRVLPRNRG